MKTALMEFFAFLLLCVIGSIVGGFLFMVYNACGSYVVGLGTNIFSTKYFIDGIFICFPGILLFVPMFLMLSLVRHSSESKVFGIVTVTVLALATWIFVVPLCAKGALARNALFAKEPSELSSGYFRKYNDKVYYFSDVKKNYVEGLSFKNDMELSKAPSEEVNILNEEYIPFQRDRYGFSDPIVGEKLKPPVVISMFFDGMFALVCGAFSVCALGWGEWLLFSLMMLAVIAAGWLVSISSWRLVCALCIVFTTFAVLVLNYLYMGYYFSSFLSQLSKTDFGGLVRDNFQSIMNIGIVVLLTVIGVVSILVSKKHEGRK